MKKSEENYQNINWDLLKFKINYQKKTQFAVKNLQQECQKNVA